MVRRIKRGRKTKTKGKKRKTSRLRLKRNKRRKKKVKESKQKRPKVIRVVFKQVGGVKDTEKDKRRKAMKPGKRVSKSGKIYYEYRKNRTDLKGGV